MDHGTRNGTGWAMGKIGCHGLGLGWDCAKTWEPGWDWELRPWDNTALYCTVVKTSKKFKTFRFRCVLLYVLRRSDL